MGQNNGADGRVKETNIDLQRCILIKDNVCIKTCKLFTKTIQHFKLVFFFFWP